MSMNSKLPPWSHDEVMLMLEAMKSEPVIWDPSEKCHKDKKKVHEAWVRIGDILEMPVDDLKRKRESLFATYRGYCRKIEQQKKKGDHSYHPVWFAFDAIDSFFGLVFKYKQEGYTENEKGAIKKEVEPNSKTQKEPTSRSRTAPTAKTHTEPTSQPEMEHNYRIRAEPSSKPTVSRITRRTENPPEKPVSGERVADAFNVFNQISNMRPKEGGVIDDECEVFGKLIAKKLRRVPESERDDIMFEIHALFRRQCIEASPSIDSQCEYAMQPDLPVKRQKFVRTQAAYLEPTIAFVTSDDYDNDGYGE